MITTISNNTNGTCTNFAGISAHTCILLHRNPNFAPVSENAIERQIDTTTTFTVLIESIIEKEEFQESRVHYTLAGIESLLKIGEGGSLVREEGVPEPLEPSPDYAPGSNKADFLTSGSWKI